MKRNKDKETSAPARTALRGGAYSIAISAVVLALVVVLNVFVGALPTTLTKYDISAPSCTRSPATPRWSSTHCSRM